MQIFDRRELIPLLSNPHSARHPKVGELAEGFPWNVFTTASFTILFAIITCFVKNQYRHYYKTCVSEKFAHANVFRFDRTMLKTCCAWLLFCLLTVHAVPPKPPVSPVGPFDNTKGENSQTHDNELLPLFLLHC